MSSSYQSVGLSELEAADGVYRSPPVESRDRRSPMRTLLAVVGVVALLALVALAASPARTPASDAASSLALAERGSGSRPDRGVERIEKGEGKSAVSPPETDAVCKDPNYTKVTLKTANEMTMVALFDDLKGEKKFEASDVIPVDNHYLVVYDNLFRIGRIDEQLQFHSNAHELIASSPARQGDSGFEAIVYDAETSTYFVVVEAELEASDKFHRASLESNREESNKEALESEPKQEESFHAWIEEVQMPAEGKHKRDEEGHSQKDGEQESGYTLKERCKSQFKFVSGNKGFEGAAHVRVNGEIVMMGLCEGNFCEGGKRGRTPGNGRIVLMRKRAATADKDCSWETVNILAIPSKAAFGDYSALAILPVSGEENKKGNLYHLAVTSQESSQVWIGQLRVTETHDAKDWSITDGVVYNFPRSDSCEVIYCNIEGVAFVDDNLLVAVSDKMKSGGKQHYRCLHKDQSIHTFVLP